MKRDYGLLPELAPIILAAFVGLVLWLFALDAMAEKRRIADYLDPCNCEETRQYQRDANTYRAKMLRHQREMEDLQRRQELRQIRMEQRQFIREHGGF